MLATITVTVLAGLSFSLLTISSSAGREERGSREETSARYVAEAGLTMALFDMANGGDGNLGSAQNPVAFGDSGYWAAVTNEGGGLFTLQSSGTDRDSGASIELVVRALNSSPFTWAAFGEDGLEMDSNAFVDSYDSTAGTYASQEINGSGNDTYAGSDGDVGSNEDITLDQNATVFGDAECGVTGAVTALGNSIISGSTSPAPEPLTLDPLDIPSFPALGDFTVASNTSTTQVAGEFTFGELDLGSGSTLTVVGPATLVFDSINLAGGSELIVDASGGPVEIFVLNDFVMNSNTLISSTTQSPGDITINLDSNNVIDPDLVVDLDEIDFDSNAKIYGTLYAPNALVEINSNFELFGSLVAHAVHLDSNSKIHFDEALLTASAGSAGAYETVSWRPIPYLD